MIELLHLSFSPVNFIPTLLMVLVLLYWFSVIIGLADFSSFDIDIDADIDTDIADTSEISVSWINGLFHYFNLGKVPLMVFVSFLALPMWVMSVIINYSLGNSSVLFSLILLIPIFLVSLFVAKILTFPFISIFKTLDKENHYAEESAVGKMCTVTLGASKDRIGQAEIRYDGSVILLNVKTNGEIIAEKGKSAVVVDHIREGNYYLIEPYEVE
jgi:hypothetical protein